jgi:hypothetical protein
MELVRVSGVFCVMCGFIRADVAVMKLLSFCNSMQTKEVSFYGYHELAISQVYWPGACAAAIQVLQHVLQKRVISVVESLVLGGSLLVHSQTILLWMGRISNRTQTVMGGFIPFYLRSRMRAA